MLLWFPTSCDVGFEGRNWHRLSSVLGHWSPSGVLLVIHQGRFAAICAMNLALNTCNDNDNVGFSCLARVTHSCAKAWQASACVSALSALYVYSVHKLMQCTSTWAVSLQVPVVVLAVCRLHELPWLFQQPYCSRVSGAGCVAPAIVRCILAVHCTVDCVGRLGCTVDCVGRLGRRST
jgi:hypothetical protein